MRALRINDFSLSPPKARSKRESLYDNENLDKDIKGGAANKPKEDAILHEKSSSILPEKERHLKELAATSRRKREFVCAVFTGILIIIYGCYVLYL